MGGVLAQTFGTQPKRLMGFMMAVVGGTRYSKLVTAVAAPR